MVADALLVVRGVAFIVDDLHAYISTPAAPLSHPRCTRD
jgi:hypothetical protein